MIEESYVSLYAGDFARLAVRAELRPLEPALVPKRIAEARLHAGVMDAKKGYGHLEALITRLRDDARRPIWRTAGGSTIAPAIVEQRQRFLNDVADTLSAPA